jgi:hypothetical protein
MDQLLEIPGDRTAGKCAYAAAGLGLAGVATLGLMYAIEVPTNGPYVFGTTNDFIGGLFNLAVIPVIIQVHRRLRPTLWTQGAKWMVVSACVAGSISSFLLVSDRLDFATSTSISVTAILIQGAWFLLAHRKLLGIGGYPRGLAKLGRFIGGAMLAAVPLAAVAFAEPAPEWLRWTVGGAGIAMGAAAWVAWPYWYFLAGKHLSHSQSESTVPTTVQEA